MPDVHRALLRDTGVGGQRVATVPSVGARTRRRSSYTLFCVTLRERIDLDFVACLAEGRGSVLAVLARELRVRQAFCLSKLVPQFTAGTMSAHIPECLVALAP